MRIFKTKKSKVAMTCLAVVLVASVVCVSLAGCSQMYGETPLGVYFISDFQSAVEDVAAITKAGETIYSVEYALQQAGIDINTDPVAAAAAIYALAVTNYNNVTQSASMMVTDAQVVARKVSTLANKDVNVGIRSTYSTFNGVKGDFSQTVSGVTQLKGLGTAGETLKTNFGYCEQTFANAYLSAKRVGNNGGAQFPTEKDLGEEVYKYILGAYNKSLTDAERGKKITLTAAADVEVPKEMPVYVQTATTYPAGSTLEGVALPSFNADRLPWQPLNRLPARIWDNDKIVEDGVTVEGTRYNYGNYGASFAFYDFSREEYLSSDTVITYNPDLDLYTIEVKVKDEYVQQACEFAAGDLVKSTKDYIGLSNAVYTESSCKFEVYGNGLIKSMQKKDVLNSNGACPLVVIKGTCKGGGSTSNTATMAFSYSDEDTNAEKWAALYWPNLGTDTLYTKNGASSLKSKKPDLSGYVTFENYKPVVNTALMEAFTNIFASK